MKNPIRLLIVDDEEIIRESIRENLKAKGNYEIQITRNGTEALKLIKGGAFDLILTDFLMPDLNGLQLYRRFKNDVQVPTILMTAFTESGVKEEFKKEGGADAITKPIDFDHLDAQIKKLVRQYKTKKPPERLKQNYEQRLPKVLLIDDQAFFAGYVTQALQDRYIVDWADKGETGINMLIEDDIDIILLDLVMPEMDGLQTFDIIKKKLPNPPPVILLTGHATVKTATKFMREGGADVIEKPIEDDELIKAIENALKKNNTRGKGE